MLVSQLWICLEVPGSDSYPRDLSCAPNSARSFVMRRTTSVSYPAIPTNFSAVTVIAEQGVLRERFSWRNAQRLGAGGGIRTPEPLQVLTKKKGLTASSPRRPLFPHAHSMDNTWAVIARLAKIRVIPASYLSNYLFSSHESD